MRLQILEVVSSLSGYDASLPRLATIKPMLMKIVFGAVRCAPYGDALYGLNAGCPEGLGYGS